MNLLSFYISFLFQYHQVRLLYLFVCPFQVIFQPRSDMSYFFSMLSCLDLLFLCSLYYLTSLQCTLHFLVKSDVWHYIAQSEKLCKVLYMVWLTFHCLNASLNSYLLMSSFCSYWDKTGFSCIYWVECFTSSYFCLLRYSSMFQQSLQVSRCLQICTRTPRYIYALFLKCFCINKASRRSRIV